MILIQTDSNQNSLQQCDEPVSLGSVLVACSLATHRLSWLHAHSPFLKTKLDEQATELLAQLRSPLPAGSYEGSQLVTWAPNHCLFFIQFAKGLGLGTMASDGSAMASGEASTPSIGGGATDAKGSSTCTLMQQSHGGNRVCRPPTCLQHARSRWWGFVIFVCPV